ncbi:MAG: DUF2244 domain-containing protein [Alphaproteobacteria bacterium]|nr:DUF2244 domain-containing protein [Alphaproteobacteria bacterium]
MSHSAASDGSVLLDLELRPHRSLPPAGFGVLMAVLGAVSLAAGIVFLSIGAWPVFGFFGLDVLAVYVAFRISYRRADMAERLRLAGDALTVDRIVRRRTAERWTFQPFWLRVQMDEPPRWDSRLVLTSHGRRLEIGAFLAPTERAGAAQALRSALSLYRRHVSAS